MKHFTIKLLVVLLLAFAVQSCYAKNVENNKVDDNMYVWYVNNPKIDAKVLKQHLNASKNKHCELRVLPRVSAVAYAADLDEEKTERLPIFKDMSDGSILILGIE